jgi:hypothetical protein
MHRVVASSLTVLVGLWASAAKAEILLFSSSTIATAFSAAGLFDLNGPTAGGTTLTFSTSQANQRVIFTFNALCSIGGSADDQRGRVKVEIILDPAGSAGEFVVPPTNSPSNSFCGGTVGSFRHGSESATYVASARPAVAGTHQVKVRVTPVTEFAGVSANVGGVASLTIMR